MNASKTVVVGLDGASFELLDPWLNAGELPAIADLVENGVTGDLESVLPPTTSPNWKAYATGKNPGKLGIFWWENIDVANRRVYYPTERKALNTEYWELLDGTVGVVGVPTTYPPRAIDGFYVSGAPDGENDGFTYPPELEGELESELDYRVTKKYSIKHDAEKAIPEILDLIDSRFVVAKRLLAARDLSFLQVSTFYINSLHHYLWDDDRTLEAWKLVDSHVSDLADEDHNVVLMSDHGSNPISWVFHINSWLEDEGYLTLRATSAEYLRRFGLTTDRLVPLATRLGLRDLAERVAPGWLIDRIPNEQGQLNRGQKTGNVDWDASLAIASGQGPVYLLTDRGSPEYEPLRRELARKLADVRTPQGDTVVEAVHDGEDVYTEEYARERPDLVIEQSDTMHLPGGLGHDDVFTAPDDVPWTAENKRHGLFVAAGPDFSTGEVKHVSILDLAPTLLHLHGRAVPEDMDGCVLDVVFHDDSDAASNPVEYAASMSRDDELRRIRQAVSRMTVSD